MKTNVTPLARLTQMRSWALSRLRVFDTNQSGAVAILCLAACLILLMISLILYDTGYAARNKLDTQNAADTAAYSQAAVKARSMNMVMYTNVAKRTIVSLHNMYQGMWSAYVIYFIYTVAKCLASAPYFTDCGDMFDNLPVFLGEQSGDQKKFKDETIDYYKEELEALEAYQVYITTLTPWWAWSEALVRGSRNGASLASSFPPPEGIQQHNHNNWAKNALQQHQISIENTTTGLTDALPLEVGSQGDTCVKFSNAFSGPAGLEVLANFLIHLNRSEEGAANSWAPALGLVFTLTTACSKAKSRFGDAMSPRKPIANSDSAQDLLKKSNIVFAYKHTPAMREKLRTNYNSIINKDYTTQTPLKHGSGMWNLSRGEFFFKGSGSPDPWTPRWTAKVRPVGLANEFQDLGYNINEMFHDVAPYIGLGMKLTGTGTDTNAAAGDAVFLEKATRSLDNSVIHGLNK